MKKYLCHWSNQNIDDAEPFVADTPHAAYLQFLDENVEYSIPVFVREIRLGGAILAFLWRNPSKHS